MHQRVVMDRGGEIILQPAGKMKLVLRGNVVHAPQQFGIAAPADFNATEQISFRARHLEKTLRFERRLRPKNRGIRLEADFGAAPVVDGAEIFELALGMALLERHLVKFLASRDLDLEPRGEGVHYGNADAVQAARGLVDLGVEFAAGMQRAHDDFERGLFREFRMGVDGDAAAIVGHGEEAVGGQFDLDEGRMARQRLVHGIVDHLGEQMMQRLFVGAADIHAGPAAHRLQAFQHLDVGSGVAGLGTASPRRSFERRTRLRRGGVEQIVIRFVFGDRFQWLRHRGSGVAHGQGGANRWA